MQPVYAVRDDGIKFQELDLDITDLFDLRPSSVSLNDLLEFHTRNTRLTPWWKEIEAAFEARPANPDGAIPDLCTWNDATLVLSPRASRYLGDLLEPYGELLPITVRGESFYIFNCLTTVEADEQKSKVEYEGNTRLGLKHIELADDAGGTLVFKVPLESCLTLYCNERFKDAVETFKLSGVVFDRNLLIPSPFDG